MRRILAISLLGLAAVQGMAFVNGDFETGDLTGWTITMTANGATAVQDAVMYDIDGPGALGTTWVGRFSVGRATTTGAAEGGIMLTQMLTLTGGVEYNFDFDWSAWRELPGGTNSQGGIFAMIVDGVEIAPRQAAGSTSPTTPKYGHMDASFTPTSTGSYSVGALIVRNFTIPTPTAPNLFQGVDNFTATAVPEPATFIAMGLGALALLRFRKK